MESHTGQERMDRMLEEIGKRDLWQELFDLRDQQRVARDKAVWLVKGDQLPLENNSQGLMRWYLHPNLKAPCISTMSIFVQEIPPGSRSGRLAHPGNMVMYIMEGEGYTLIDGQKFIWAEGDTVQIPARPNGVVFQHFNTSEVATAKFVASEPNLVHSTGMDRGGLFEQLEPSPEYRKPKPR